MKSTAKVFAITLIFAITCVFSKPVFAVDSPSFPACVSPTGTLISSYPSGNFGIAGKEGSFAGSDSVYSVSEDALTQCFCATDGTGIQTNFWKASSLSSDQINELISEGWIFIPDGSVWGLASSPFLAKNSDFSCSNGGGNSGGSSSSNGGSSSSNSNSNSGSVLSAAASVGQVLGLASTGNMQAIALLFVLGLLLTGFGTLILRKK